MRLAVSRGALDLSAKTFIMGVLNVTPDSFSDGGRYIDHDTALRHAEAMAADGADIIDIGGESTRPGSDPLSLDEELGRVIPVIKELSGRISIPISIDTHKSEVAKRALETGASIVNDISGLRFDPRMARVAAECKAVVVLMHIRGTPKDMQTNPVYTDLIGEIKDYLAGSIAIATSAGIDEDRIVIDPGIGFGKTFDHNLEIIRRLSELKSLGMPILIGPSRKAFIGKILGGLPPSERVEGTAAAVAVSIMNGANIVRVHDVREMSRVARMTDAIARS